MRNLTCRILTGAVLLMALQGCGSSAGWYHLPPAEFDAIDYGYEVKTAQVRNIEVGYIDQGSGEVLLLIHGLGSNAKAWQRNIPDLAADHRVIAVDLPGYGYSDKGDYQYSMSFYATVLSELLAGLGVDKAVWVGHSMGGQIAMVAALEHPRAGRRAWCWSRRPASRPSPTAKATGCARRSRPSSSRTRPSATSR